MPRNAMPYHAKSGQIRSRQVRSGHTMKSHIRSDQVRSHRAMPGQVRSYDRSDQVRPCRAKPDQIKSGQISPFPFKVQCNRSGKNASAHSLRKRGEVWGGGRGWGGGKERQNYWLLAKHAGLYSELLQTLKKRKLDSS